MSGTKHEKTVLIILTYIIGFTSGLMAVNLFSYSVPIQEPIMMEEIINTPEPEALEVPTQNPVSEVPAVEPVGEMVTYVDGRLYATVGDSKVVLSISVVSLGEEVPEEFVSQGTHISEPFYLSSPDGLYVYFCEQQGTDESCVSYVYDTTSSLIQPVTALSQKIDVSNEEASIATWSEGSLRVGSFVSVSSSESPWVVEAR